MHRLSPWAAKEILIEIKIIYIYWRAKIEAAAVESGNVEIKVIKNNKNL